MINEGKYDKITGIISDKLLRLITDTRNNYDDTKTGKKDNLSAFELNYNYSDINLKITLIIQRYPEANAAFSGLYECVKINNTYEHFIKCHYTGDPNFEPKIYNRLNTEIQGTVRHELEHFLQTLGELYPNIYPYQYPYKRKDLNRIDFGDKYFLDRDEIPAFIHDTYKKAKHMKKSFSAVLIEYLKNMIEQGKLKKNRYQHVLDTLIKYAKQLTPSAQFSLTEYDIKSNYEKWALQHPLESTKYWALYAGLYEKDIINAKSIKDLQNRLKHTLLAMTNEDAIKAYKMFIMYQADVIKGLITENPDEVRTNAGSNLSWGSPDSYVFGFLDGEMEIAKKSMHTDLGASNESPNRNDFVFSGRLWAESKIISFWDYPKSRVELLTVLKNITQAISKKYNLKISFDSSWSIEIPKNAKISTKRNSEDLDWSDKDENEFDIIPLRNFDGLESEDPQSHDYIRKSIFSKQPGIFTETKDKNEKK